MKKFFSLNSIKLREKKNASNFFQRNGENKRLSNISTSSLASRQSFFNIEVIREGYNVDISRVDETFTKLHRACLLNYSEKKVLKYISKHPLSINKIDNVSNCSPLHLCVVNNNLNLLKILLDNGGDINLKDGHGKTLLIKAIECKNDFLIQFLISNNADVNRSDSKFNNTPLHWAIIISNSKAISTLLNCTNINVNLVNDKKETPLHFIAKSNQNLHTFISDCLDNNGLNLDVEDEEGRTPLFVACLNGNYDCAETLVKLNADTLIKNNSKETSYEVAKKKGFLDIVKLLEDNENDEKNSKSKSIEVLSNFNFKNSSAYDNEKKDEDSWPESDSEKSLLNNNLKININNKIKVENYDQNSFNSFKKNTNISSSSFSSNELSFDKNKKTKEDNIKSNLDKETDSSQNKSNNQAYLSKNEIFYSENDEFIQQMKLAIDEEIDLNEELDKVLFSSSQKTEKNIDSNKKAYKIYISDDEASIDEDYTQTKKVKFNSETEKFNNENDFKNNQTKSNFVYGLSDEEEIDKTFTKINFDNEINQENEKKSVSSSISSKSFKENSIVDKFDDLMQKIEVYEKKNNTLSIELNDAKERELQLKLLNQQLKLEFENQKIQINSLEERLKQSDQNYLLIKDESEQFKNDFKFEREKFVKFIQEEYKQSEEHLLNLLNNKQETCDYLTSELNLLKEKYQKQLDNTVDEKDFQDNDKNSFKTFNEVTLKNFMNQNEKLNQSLSQIETFFNKQKLLNDSISKLSDVLTKIENQLNVKFSQLNNQFNNQNEDITNFIKSNISQSLQNFFENELEIKVNQVKDLIDDLKLELLNFIQTHKKQNTSETEIDFDKIINQFVDLMDQKFLIEKNFSKEIVKNIDENKKLKEQNDEKNLVFSKPSKSSSNESFENKKFTQNNNFNKNLKNKNNFSKNKNIHFRKGCLKTQNKKFKSLNNLSEQENEFNSYYDYDESYSDFEQENESNLNKKKFYPNKRVKNNFLINQHKSSFLNSIDNNFEAGSQDLKISNKLIKNKKINLKSNLLKNTNRYIKNHLNIVNKKRYQNNLNTSPRKLSNNNLNKLKYQKIYQKNNNFSYNSLSNIYLDDENFKSYSNNLNDYLFDSNSMFKKRRQTLEQDISKLKIELGLLNENYSLKSSSLWNL